MYNWRRSRLLESFSNFSLEIEAKNFLMENFFSTNSTSLCSQFASTQTVSISTAYKSIEAIPLQPKEQRFHFHIPKLYLEMNFHLIDVAITF